MAKHTILYEIQTKCLYKSVWLKNNMSTVNKIPIHFSILQKFNLKTYTPSLIHTSSNRDELEFLHSRNSKTTIEGMWFKLKLDITYSVVYCLDEQHWISNKISSLALGSCFFSIKVSSFSLICPLPMANGWVETNGQVERANWHIKRLTPHRVHIWTRMTSGMTFRRINRWTWAYLLEVKVFSVQ